MPHPRHRLVMPLLQKKLKFSPVVTIQGARQIGKSFLVRELLKDELESLGYVSFDQQSKLDFAERSPDTFLEDHNDFEPLAIDEAQKVPAIFDAVKFTVDQDRRPGRFILLGSTEFSRQVRVRESLTGRVGRIRLFPFTVRECVSGSAELKRKDLLNYLKCGGMPAIFSIRDEDEQKSHFQDWIDLVCLRDIHQFKDQKLDSNLCIRLFILAAQLELPTAQAMAIHTKIDLRKIKRHLEALVQLFALTKIDPHPSCRGKSIYLILDAGIAQYLGASKMRCLHILLMNERMAKNYYFKEKRKQFFYYLSPGKKMIHWVEESLEKDLEAFQLFDSERIKKTDALLLQAFLKKNPGAKGAVYAPVSSNQKVEGVVFKPWEDFLLNT